MPPALSVVLAVDGPTDHLSVCTKAIARACRNLDAELLIVHAPGTPVVVDQDVGMHTRTIVGPDPLVPRLWGVGIANAGGDAVALTTTQFRVTDEWAAALLEPLRHEDVVGAGGSMIVSSDASALVRAVFLIRYSEHMSVPGAPPPGEIAGDNAAYKRAAIGRACPEVAKGFWEVDVHRIMRAQGGRIVHAPGAVAEFAPALSMREMFANRLVHGSHFGGYRVKVLGWPRILAVGVTPLVPAVLLMRILGRVRRGGQSLVSTLPLLPGMVTLLCAWAAGEARGALLAGRSHATK
jgi:hypothetical protein